MTTSDLSIDIMRFVSHARIARIKCHMSTKLCRKQARSKSELMRSSVFMDK